MSTPGPSSAPTPAIPPAWCDAGGNAHAGGRAKEHGLFIIGDEAYREFVYAGEPLQSMGQFADAAENVIVIDTVSKRFSACGARIGCLITRNRS